MPVPPPSSLHAEHPVPQCVGEDHITPSEQAVPTTGSRVPTPLSRNKEAPLSKQYDERQRAREIAD